jgi:hypothetical protein
MALLAAALVLGVPAAHAANIAPNPGFEDTSCSMSLTVVCNWTPLNGTFLSYTASSHTGSRSMRVLSNASSSIVTARSDCFAVTPGTTYGMGIWYQAAPPVTIGQVVYAATFFSDAGCTGFTQSPQAVIVNSPLIDGVWHQATAQVTAPGGNPFSAQSATLQINFSCTGTCAETQAINYDDLRFDTSLAATVFGLSAKRARKGVVVRWRTGTEVDALGYNVYRQQGRRRVRLNKRVIPALTLTRGGTSGGAYSYVDRRAPRHRSLRYWLQDVDLNGNRTWHGPLAVRSA